MGQANLIVAFHKIVAGLGGQPEFVAIFVFEVFDFAVATRPWRRFDRANLFAM